MDPKWFETGRRVVVQAWRWHYRIPRWVYWATITACVGVAILRDPAQPELIDGAILLAAAVAAAGLVRWHVESHPVPVIAVPLFAAPSKEKRAVAEETQGSS